MAIAENTVILSGILDLPQQAETAAIDGCKKRQKGLTLNGGFLLIACEKLRPEFPISTQNAAADRYVEDILTMGWDIDLEQQESGKMNFLKEDDKGCVSKLSVMVWTDRSMNEPRPPESSREDHRQIVFVTKFDGEGRCDHHYDAVKHIADSAP